MILKDIMDPHPLTLTEECAVREAARLFLENNADSAPVVDWEGRLVGLFTIHHINHVVAQGLDAAMPVSRLMKRELITCSPEDRVEDLAYFDQGQLPVTENGKLLGIITRKVFARAITEFYRKISGEFQAIINSATYMIISIDKKGAVNVFNRAAERILAVDAGSAAGKSVTEFLPEIDVKEIIEHRKGTFIQKLMVGGSPFIMSSFPIYQNDEFVGVVFRVQDVSELEEMSRELAYVRELNRDLDAIIESSHDGIWVTDGEGNVLRINRAYETMTGLPCRTFYGRNMSELVGEGFFSQSVTLLVMEKKSQQTIFQETRTGKSLLVTGSPIFDENGTITRVVTNVRDVTELKQLFAELEESQRIAHIYRNELNDLRHKYKTYDRIIWNSAVMERFIDSVARIGQVNSTVLISGESGTGKELIAEYIHANSSRALKPLIKINCGAIPEDLIESELFGYDAGAFTGAKKGGKPGYFELAHGGTLFLDEIGEMKLNLQTKLLRVMESGEVTRIGGEKPRGIDVRVIAATNKNLSEMVHQKIFREDLYYRLNVVPLNIPPLRERKDDIPNLIAHFVSLFNQTHGMEKKILPEVVDICMGHDWPGNVRELKNLVERMMVMSAGNIIEKADLPASFGRGLSGDEPRILVNSLMPLPEAVMSVEKQLIERAYALYRTTREMARELKIDASTIVRKAAKYGVSRVKDEDPR